MECPNAQLRRRGLYQFNVRGLAKARAVLLWHALAHNLMRMASLKMACKRLGTAPRRSLLERRSSGVVAAYRSAAAMRNDSQFFRHARSAMHCSGHP